MTPERHQLVWLSPAGWAEVQAADWDTDARACLSHWAAARLPLVTTRQHRTDRLALGLPAPLAFGRRRFALEVARHDDSIAARGAFPFADEITALLAADDRAAWQALCGTLRAFACDARVHGSFGWQHLTGLPCVHRDSDIDLLLPVASDAHADAVCIALTEAEARSPRSAPRLDGECVFADGAGIAWREWQAWRTGRVAEVLVKRIDAVTLRSGAQALRRAA